MCTHARTHTQGQLLSNNSLCFVFMRHSHTHAHIHGTHTPHTQSSCMPHSHMDNHAIMHTHLSLYFHNTLMHTTLTYTHTLPHHSRAHSCVVTRVSMYTPVCPQRVTLSCFIFFLNLKFTAKNISCIKIK